jgi:hypothetical protein
VSDKAQALAATWGEWIKRPANILTTLAGIIAIAAGARQAAESLDSPLLRWSATGIAALLFLGACVLGREVEPGVQNPVTGTAEPVRRGPKVGHVLGFLAATTFLTVDLLYSYSGYVSLVTFRSAEVQPRSYTFVVLDTEAERLVEKRGSAYGVLSPKGLPFPDEHGPQLTFEFRKKPNVKELVIDELTLTVVGYAPAPQFHQMVGGAAFTEETKAVFVLEQKQEPLPWSFHPTKVESGGIWKDWQPGELVVRDDFISPFRCYVMASQSGIYTFRLDMRVRNEYGRTEDVSLTKEPLTFAYLEAAAQEASKSPEIQKRLKMIGYGSVPFAFDQPAEATKPAPLPEDTIIVNVPVDKVVNTPDGPVRVTVTEQAVVKRPPKKDPADKK